MLPKPSLAATPGYSPDHRAPLALSLAVALLAACGSDGSDTLPDAAPDAGIDAGEPGHADAALPARPLTIGSVRLEGVADPLDRAVRQGGSATLIIEGTGLERVAGATLEHAEVDFPPLLASPSELHLRIHVDHGAPTL